MYPVHLFFLAFILPFFLYDLFIYERRMLINEHYIALTYSLHSINLYYRIPVTVSQSIFFYKLFKTKIQLLTTKKSQIWHKK
jgi:hypothetical protein